LKKRGGGDKTTESELNLLIMQIVFEKKKGFQKGQIRLNKTIYDNANRFLILSLIKIQVIFLTQLVIAS